jgi:hypothetical protein
MATVHLNTHACENAPNSSTTRSQSITRDDLPLFRFGLRQLFLFVACISALFAALVSTHGVAAIVMLLAALVVTLHIFATALGSRLRTRADRNQIFEAAERLPIKSIASEAERSAQVAAVRSGARSPWHSRGVTVLPWLRRLVLAAVACGGIAGATYLALTIGYRTSPAGIVVGSLSVAVLFGWFAFLFGSFYGVFRHGFRDAMAKDQGDQRPAAAREVANFKARRSIEKTPTDATIAEGVEAELH